MERRKIILYKWGNHYEKSTEKVESNQSRKTNCYWFNYWYHPGCNGSASCKAIVILGSLFVGALKGIAPILVLFLVMSAIAGHKKGQQTNMKSIISLYLLGTFLAGLIAVIISFIFPVSITLTKGAEDLVAPGGVIEVLKTLLLKCCR